MTPTLRTTVWIVAMTVVVLGLAGCGSLDKGHEENVNAAEGRWRSARSGLMLSMAQRQFDTGDLDQAEKTLREAVTMDPDNARLHLLAGRIAIERGNLEHAGNLFRFALEISDRMAEAHYYYALVYQRWQQYDNALTHYEKAFELESDNPAYLLAACEMLVALDRWQDALAQLEEHLVYFDQNAGIRVAVGQIHLLHGDFGKAVIYFREASLLRPDDRQISEALALSRVGAGDYERAALELEHLLAQVSYGKRRDLKLALGRCYGSLRRYDQAKQVYLDLTRSEPTDVEAWLGLGETVLALDDLSGTLLAANRVAALAPHRHEGYLMAGIVWQKRGHLERALAGFNRAAELAPENATPVVMRGLALEREGKREAAADAYREALERQPEDIQVRQLLANVSQ